MTNLALTTLSDTHGSRQWRNCGKFWIASLLRHQWNGIIESHRNFPQPLFPVERASLHEKGFFPAFGAPASKEIPWKSISRKHQLDAARRVTTPEEFGWVLFADADCVALRNPDHLFVRDGDLLVSSTQGLPDPGFVAVRGNRLHEFIYHLETSGGLKQIPLAAVINSGKWKVQEFERGEVLRPNDPGMTLEDLANAAVVHFAGMKPEDKQRLAFAFHMMAVYGDRDGLFFDMIEA